MRKVRRNFYLISLLAAIFAVYLSFQYEYREASTSGSREWQDPVPVSVSNTIDSGLDGGASGFAILSGLSLVAASITYLAENTNERKEG